MSSRCDCWADGGRGDFNRNAMAADSLGRESEVTVPSYPMSRNATAGVPLATISRSAIQFIGTRSCRRFATLFFCAA